MQFNLDGLDVKSDLTVGPPIDIAIFKKDEKKLSYLKCLNTSDEDYKKICNQWSDKVLQVFDTFPKIGSSHLFKTAKTFSSSAFFISY